ncbi:MAG: hypothetical protein ABJP48_00210 [Erythrobacter sp.]
MKFENRIVVFIDILGFGSLVERAALDPDGAHSKRLACALAIISNLELHRSDHVAGKSAANPLHTADIQLQIFSDSVILSILPDPEGLKSLFHHLSRAFIALMRVGVYIRGGIAFGQISTDACSPCGPAVNAAYRIESNVSDWPRLVLNSSMVEYCRSNCPRLLESSMIERHETDGVFLLSPIMYATESQAEFGWPICEMAPDICAQLNDALSSIVDDPKNYKKMAALAEQWNWFIDPKKSACDGNHRTEGYVDFVEVIDRGLNSDLVMSNIDIGGLPELP